MNDIPQNPDKNDQGLLFESDLLRLGTDPNDKVVEKFKEPPKGEGVYPSDQEPKAPIISPADAEFAKKAHDAYLEDRTGPDEIKQLSQKGKHNPFSRAKNHGSTEYHEFVKMGDAVPGFSGGFIKSEEQLEEARKFLKDKYERQ